MTTDHDEILTRLAVGSAENNDMSVAILTALELVVLSWMLGGLIVKRQRAAVVPVRILDER